MRKESSQLSCSTGSSFQQEEHEIVLEEQARLNRLRRKILKAADPTKFTITEAEEASFSSSEENQVNNESSETEKAAAVSAFSEAVQEHLRKSVLRTLQRVLCEHFTVNLCARMKNVMRRRLLKRIRRHVLFEISKTSQLESSSLVHVYCRSVRERLVQFEAECRASLVADLVEDTESLSSLLLEQQTEELKAAVLFEYERKARAVFRLRPLVKIRLKLGIPTKKRRAIAANESDESDSDSEEEVATPRRSTGSSAVLYERKSRVLLDTEDSKLCTLKNIIFKSQK